MVYEGAPADQMRRIADGKIAVKDRAALLYLLDAPEGRWFLMRLFERCHLMGGVLPSDDVNALLIREGERRVGLHIQKLVTDDLAALSARQEAEREYYAFMNELQELIAAVETKEESISVALSEAEIERLVAFDFSKDKKLENTRDLMILGLWTGLRVSDVMTLPAIDPDSKFIEVEPQKTRNTSGAKVVIPLHHHIKEMIRKRGMPTPLNSIVFNSNIKEVCRLVGFTELVEGSLMNPQTRRKERGVFEKWQLISSHTCRRSFATNLYLMNFPTLSIMKITGHTTEASFLKYIKVTPKEHAEKLLAHWEEYYKDKNKAP